MLFFAVLLSSIHKRNHHAPGQKFEENAMIVKGKGLLKDGDIVVRLHKSPASAIIKGLNQVDKSYSHAGIVQIENGKPEVYHIMPSEGNLKGVIRKASFNHFCDPTENAAFGIYRYQLSSDELAKEKTILQKWFEEKIAFDPLFDLLSNDRMYCSEMVAKLIENATQQRLNIKPTTITESELKLFRAKYNLPESCGQGGMVYSIDNLYLNNSCECVMRFNF